MNKSILHPFIGQTIQRVTYFEINDPEPPIFFEGFHNFDLGIEIEFSNGSHWHIGWKNNDRPEIGIGQYNPKKYFKEFKTIDATAHWSPFLGASVRDIELIYVSEAWKIPAQCTLYFDNKPSVSIVLGEELNPDHSVPLPLKYVDNCEFYVFHEKEMFTLELVEIILQDEFEDEEYIYEERQGISTSSFLLIVFILIILVLIIRWIF